MRRYLEAVTESAGIDNLAGFNDDTRALPSIAARHDLWRRAVAAWAAVRLPASDGRTAEATARANWKSTETVKREHVLAGTAEAARLQ